jgi:hypothetical protein
VFAIQISPQLSRRLTAVIYLLTAALISLLIADRSPNPGRGVRELFLFWLLGCAIPLFFVFSYPMFLFGNTPRTRAKRAAILHCALAIFAVLFFEAASSRMENPVDTISDSKSIVILLFALAALALLLVSAVCLCLKKRSMRATIASVVLWFYWLFLFLVVSGHWFQAAGAHRQWFFPCCVAPLFLSFAAGAIRYRASVAHGAALLGLVAAPWLYWNVVRDTGLGNVWLIFNEPDSPLELFSSSQVAFAAIAVLSVGLLTFALVTAAVHLLAALHLGRLSLRRLRWLPFAVSFAVLMLWFSRSVMPYRIPGAVDSDRPMLQILHVEKHGLQFHERCVKVWGGWNGVLRSVSFSGDDRRLFQYSFTENQQSGGELSSAFRDRIRELFPSSSRSRESEDVHPIRAWNADAWYVSEQHSGLQIYGIDGRPTPPETIVALFSDLEKIPHSSSYGWQLRDVCLGFCYDPLSAMGALFWNHRCFDAGHGPVCK